MSPTITRRDFLKLSLLTGGSLLSPSLSPGEKISEDPKNGKPNDRQKNIAILVLDTLFAGAISLYGYDRQTMPNLTQIAEHGMVYHHHRAPANFTAPSTASLLTGVYPWDHRAINNYGVVTDHFLDRNIFSLLPKTYFRFAHSQNYLAQNNLIKFLDHIDILQPAAATSIHSELLSEQVLFNDLDIALHAEQELRGLSGKRPSGLLFLSIADLIKRVTDRYKLLSKNEAEYPYGVPISNEGTYFFLNETMQWLNQQFEVLPKPFFAYIHLLPPHEPYRPESEFVDALGGVRNRFKPEHIFSEGHSPQVLNLHRKNYEEFILNVDAELGRFFQSFQEKGLGADTYLFITSDHGQMFERGIHGHWNPTLFNPLLHIPLVILPPGKFDRQDFYTPTSTLDILPTLLHLTGGNIPDWCDGMVLPGFSNEPPNLQRSLYALDAKSNSKFMPLTNGTMAMEKNNYKLIYYFGYPGIDNFYEFYDLENDSEELNNLYNPYSGLASVMVDELHSQLWDANNGLSEK